MKQSSADLLELVIRPTLNMLEMGGENAEALMLGTALAESGGHAFRQQGGPALGIWQVEPDTHDDVWRNYLKFRQGLGEKVLQAGEVATDWKAWPDPALLAYNARYCCAIARLVYWRDPEPLPDTIEGMAWAWKRIFNTALGKGTVGHFMEAWHNA